ncbi:molecular chaperone Hsp33 [Amphibacillus marinus]|uniref:Molecular chaperone Hsp33 n=1 Tax=Amphibacillus marinus TaxID=872970 RepID=A0A1H8H6M7_9BACI|nr:Hsp33 family molecular chaperone HslO [Amphibacillus marinus]SEN51992.1 molecular chaperone Hsp33 [Amphibacillus marinus]
MKNLVRFLTRDKEFRIFIVDVRSILECSYFKNMKTDFARQLYTNIFINCCLLRGFITEMDQRISVSVRFKLAGHTAHCEIDGSGKISCVFSSSLTNFNGVFEDLIGQGATLSMSRGSWTGGMFTGTVELTATSVDSWFSYFYEKSEQTKTIFQTWNANGIVRGCMVQPLPLYSRSNLKNIKEYICNLDMISIKWANIPYEISLFATKVDEYDLLSACNCSKDFFSKILMSIETNELIESIKAEKKEEMECGICGEKYLFNTDDLKNIVKIMGSDQSE